jgi:WD40 repeat protein
MIGGIEIREYSIHSPAYSEIRVWTMGGDVIYTLSGHSSFVYSLAALPDGDVVSAGEDRSVRIWQGMWVALCKKLISDGQS